MRANSSPDATRGQMLVIAALALVAVVGMVGLVLDGGALFAQQRVAQNGADGAATAGTVVIAEYMGGATGRDNLAVYNAVAASALANGLAGWAAEYTDDFGAPIGINVTNTCRADPDGRGRRPGHRLADGQHDLQPDPRVRSDPGDRRSDGRRGPAQRRVRRGRRRLRAPARSRSRSRSPVRLSRQPHPGPMGRRTASRARPGRRVLAHRRRRVTAGWHVRRTATSKMAILPLCKSASGGSGAFGWLDLAAGDEPRPGDHRSPEHHGRPPGLVPDARRATRTASTTSCPPTSASRS